MTKKKPGWLYHVHRGTWQPARKKIVTCTKQTDKRPGQVRSAVHMQVQIMKTRKVKMHYAFKNVLWLGLCTVVGSVSVVITKNLTLIRIDAKL